MLQRTILDAGEASDEWSAAGWPLRASVAPSDGVPGTTNAAAFDAHRPAVNA